MRATLTITILFTTLFLACGENKIAHQAKTHEKLFPADIVVNQTLQQNLELLGKPNSESIDIDRDSAVVHNYEKDNFQMIITYNSNTNKPLEVFITTLTKYYPENIDDYYTVANVNVKDSNYTLVPYKSMNDLALFRGVAVVPNQSVKAK